MNKTEKIKEDERGTAMVVWSFIVILIIVIVAIVIWSGGSGSGSSQSAEPISITASTTDISSTTDNQIKNNEHMITIQTNKGVIVFETYDADAPNTVANFINLADKGFYNGVIFHRVIQGFMIQGGDPTGTGRGGPGYTFADELNPATQSYKTGYIRGTVAMANAGPDTNGSQFFIVQKDTPLPNSYTIFGHVISGMDVVDAIAAVPVDANDKPLSPITMEKVTVATTSSTTAQ
jgi:peptidyl-prolyl cis-trans isomerase B (cyclophilin B)